MSIFTIPFPAPETIALAKKGHGRSDFYTEVGAEHARDITLLSATFENALIKHRAQRRWLIFTGPTWRRLSRLVFGLIRFSFKDELALAFDKMKMKEEGRMLESQIRWEKSCADMWEKTCARQHQDIDRAEVLIRDLRHRVSKLSRALEKTHQPKLP